MAEIALIAIGFVVGSLFTVYCWRKEICRQPRRHGFQPNKIGEFKGDNPPSNWSSAVKPGYRQAPKCGNGDKRRIEMKFELTPEQVEKANVWMEDKQKDGAYTGTIGDRFSYQFGQTSLGQTQGVYDHVTKEYLCLTDFSNW